MATDQDLAIEEIKNRQESGVWDWTVGALEAIPAIGSMIAAEPIAGYVGLVSSPYTGSRAGSVVDSVRGSATYQPRTKEGQSILRGAANGLGWVMDKAKMIPAGYAGMYQLAAGRGLGDAADAVGNVRGADYSQTLGDATFEATGSPALAAAAYSIPTAIAESVGLKGAGRLKGTALEIGDIGSQGYSKQKGMFAGVNAKNADLDAMKAAQELADRGVGRDEIWKNTGWFKDGDGHWKWEIDDSTSKLRDEGLRSFHYETDLVRQNRMMDHANLAESYPDTKNISYRKGADSGAAYDPRSDTIKLAPDAGHPDMFPEARDDLVKSPAIHELQHAVASREGHSPGGSPLDQSSYDKWMHNKEFYRAELDGIRAKMSKEPEYTRLQMDAARAKDIDSARAAAVKVKEFEDRYPGYADAAGEFNRAVEYTRYTPHEAYLRLGGEAEARNAQTRMNYSPEERRQTPPWETLDVPESEISY